MNGCLGHGRKTPRAAVQGHPGLSVNRITSGEATVWKMTGRSTIPSLCGSRGALPGPKRQAPWSKQMACRSSIASSWDGASGEGLSDYPTNNPEPCEREKTRKRNEQRKSTWNLELVPQSQIKSWLRIQPEQENYHYTPKPLKASRRWPIA